MKQSCLILVAIIILIGCKPKSQSNSGFNLPDAGDIKNKNNSNNSGTSGKWTSSYRESMEQDIKIYADKEGIHTSKVNDFADCVLNSLEAKFPNENVDKQSAEAQAILKDCESRYSGNQTGDNNYNNSNNSNNSNSYNNSNSQGWSSSDQQEFMDNCVPGASKSLGSSTATSYCSCMMNKLMAEYPNSKDIGTVSKEHMTELAKDCIQR